MLLEREVINTTGNCVLLFKSKEFTDDIFKTQIKWINKLQQDRMPKTGIHGKAAYWAPFLIWSD